MFSWSALGVSDSTLVINGHSSPAGGFVVGDNDEVEFETILDASSVAEPRLYFFADCFLGRERKGKRDVFGVLAFRRASSVAVGSSSGCIH